MIALLLPLALGSLARPATAQTPAPALEVRYRSAETIYLNAGRAEGLAVGDRLEVLRGGRAVAELEVIFTAEHSASCRILAERETIRPADRVRRIGEAAGPSPTPSGPAPTPSAAPPAAPAPSSPEPLSPVPREPEAARSSRSYGTGLSRTRLVGTLSLDWESFADGSEAGRDFDRTAARVFLRARDLGGLPWDLRVRLRSARDQRSRVLAHTVPESESRDRLYELALVHDRPDSRYALRVGRLGSGPFSGIGYLDGALAEVRVLPRLAVGGFYGLRPDIEELGFENSGSKLGALVRLTPGPETGGPFEVLLAGVREEGETDVSREFAVLESRWDAGDRWSFFQRAELDFNRGWRREAAGTGSQLSNVALTALARVSERGRFAISYDRLETYRTEETRFLPEELFADLLRQGLRVSYRHGSPGSLNLWIEGGLRDGQDRGDGNGSGILLDAAEEERTYSLGLGASHPRLLGLSLGADVLGFSNPLTDGLLVTGRVGRSLAGGHEVGLAVGATLYRETLIERDRSTGWARASLWLELPLDLFGRAEYELSAGDDVEGQRLSLGLGYRF